MLENHKVAETDRFTRFEIDGHIIALSKIWSYAGGMSNHLFMLIVDGKNKMFSHNIRKRNKKSR